MNNPFVTDRVYKEEDFSAVRLPKGDYDNCTFRGCTFSDGFLDNAIFDASNLQQADFSLSHNMILDPERNQLKNARFSSENVKGLLVKYKVQVIDS